MDWLRRYGLWGVIAWLAAYLVIFTWPTDSDMRIIFLDVGQGDATLIETPDGQQILVDAGAGQIVLTELGRVFKPWDRDLDVIVLTHADSDHMGGFIPIFQRYQVDQIWDNQLPEVEKPEYDEFLRLAAAESAEVIDVHTGTKLFLDHDVWLEAYASADAESDLNANSIVLRVMQGGRCLALLTGDIDEAEEQDILREDFSVRCEVYKAGHHGSRTSSSEAFVQAVNPRLSIISAGANNSYGHPHQEVVERLERFSPLVYQTAVHGQIEVIVDGKGEMWVETEK